MFRAKQKFYASSWLITEINILRCTVSTTSKYVMFVAVVIRNVTSVILQLSLYKAVAVFFLQPRTVILADTFEH